MKEKITILHIVTHMNCGGLETMIMNYYRSIDKERFQFDFLTHRPADENKDYVNEIKSLGGKIYHLPKLNPFSLKYRKSLERFFEEHREYKIIHVHQDCMSGLILKIAKKVGVPIRIAHCHSSNQDKNPKYVIKSLYKHLIVKYSTDLFACGKVAGEWMFGKRANFIVLPNAIDTDKYIYSKDKRLLIRQQLNIPYDAVVIGHVGRFSKVKNHRFIVKLTEYLLSQNRNIYVLFIGQGDLFYEIKNIVIEKKLDNVVKFLGLRHDVYDLMQAMDVFILPSLYEGLPVSIIEAQSSGLPCIISKNVPMDCAITTLVKQCDLDLDKWTNLIFDLKNINRVDTQSEIKKAGFDIKENTKFLEEYYTSCFSNIYTGE